MISSIPDSLLRGVSTLPHPLSRVCFSIMRRGYKAIAKIAPVNVKIGFGSGIRISAPLAHPSVYWRYRPKTTNRNFLLLAQLISQETPGLIIDVGANIGDGAALLRGHGVNEPLLLVEGSKRWFDLMVANTEGFEDTICANALLGATSRTIKASLDEERGTGKLVEGGNAITLRTLDDVVDEYCPDAEPRYLKTDTDGYDVQVLRGASSILRKHQPVVFTECAEGLLREQGNSVAEMFELMQTHGYTQVAVWDHVGNWMGLRTIEQGVESLLGKFPGGHQEAFLDVAFLADRHQAIRDSLLKQATQDS